MNAPLFWLGISILLVAISLMALLTVAILVLQELARAARSAEKLLDTLNRELPTTLQDLRLTSKELSELSGEVSGSVQSARSVAEQVDRGLLEAKAQAQKAHVTTRGLFAGATAALNVLARPSRRRRRPPTRPALKPLVSDRTLAPGAEVTPTSSTVLERPKPQSVPEIEVTASSTPTERSNRSNTDNQSAYRQNPAD